MLGIKIKVTGKVQGVFYRASAKDKAQQLGLSGMVKNEQDGSVYIEAEGEEQKLKELIDWCHHGPDMAQVENVEYEYYSRLNNFSEFKIIR